MSITEERPAAPPEADPQAEAFWDAVNLFASAVLPVNEAVADRRAVTSGEQAAVRGAARRIVEAIDAYQEAALGFRLQLVPDVAPAGEQAFGPPRSMRTAGGDVCYRSVAVVGVPVGDGVQAVHGDPDWHLVEHVTRGDESIGLAHDRTRLRWWERGELVRVACSIDELAVREEAAERRADARDGAVPDPEPFRMVPSTDPLQSGRELREVKG